ncbi:conserved hypothetical protein [uncultured Desulfobacterium sp.]|uniref:Serine protease n=1 Tax=uncultured Desulfobacterium sp. TaxID=201089 RepID=A0A445MUE1_9BACT|nr:conserved hypothetical protein [uncultured Desulfobacterium sp.]
MGRCKTEIWLLSFKICLFFFCLLFLDSAFTTEKEGETKSYPLPINEIEEVISDWLRDSDFVVHKNVLDGGQIELSAIRAKAKWRILLKPHSALASDVQASFTVDDRFDKSQVSGLWASLAYYIKPSHTQYTAKDNRPGRNIPNGVLSRIESVVCIKATGQCDDEQFSGFIFKTIGLVLSTAHGLEGCSDIRVILYDGRELKGHVVKKDTHRDLTLIRINAKLESFTPLARGREMIAMGEKIYSIGCPENQGGEVFSGVVNGPQRRVKDLVYWQVEMKIFPGSSGSPVFDEKGNLVGIVKGRFRGGDSVGFLIPFGTIREFLNSGEITP